MSPRLGRIGWAVLTLAVAFPLQGAAPCLGGGPADSAGPAASKTSRTIWAAHRSPCGGPVLRGAKSPDLGAGCIGEPEACFGD